MVCDERHLTVPGLRHPAISVWGDMRDHSTPSTVNGQTMHDILGITVRAYDLDGEDLGQISLPAPVLVGDLASFERGLAPEIVSVLREGGLPIAVKLRPVRFQPARR